MGSYRVFIKPSAVKEIEAVADKKNRRRLVLKIQQLADNPRPLGCQKLSGREWYRIRQGQYRIVYSIQDKDLTVHVIKVGHRRDVYRDAP